MIFATGAKPFTTYQLQKTKYKQENLNQPCGINNTALIDTKYNSLLVKKYNPVNFGEKINFPEDLPYAKEPCDIEKADIPKRFRNRIQNDFFNLLVKYVPQSGYKPVKEDETIVSIGCGNAMEALPMSAYFGRKSNFIKGNENTHVYGIDNDAGELASANGYYGKDYEQKFPWLHLICDDARGISQNANIPKNVDVVIMRHPNICGNGGVCKNMIEDSLKILRPGGIMIFTTYWKQENEKLVEIIKNLPEVKITVDQETGNDQDSHILIIKKEG